MGMAIEVPFEVRCESQGDIIFAQVIGEADIVNAAKLETLCMPLVAQRPRKMIVDLSQLTFISSMAMGKLIAARKTVIKHGGEVILAAPSPLVHEALRRARLHDIFPIASSVEEARDG